MNTQSFQQWLGESRQETSDFKEFVKVRMEGAAKIAESAKIKGGIANLTHQHFIVKLPYYKMALEKELDRNQMQSELSQLVEELAQGVGNSVKLNSVHFQRLVGKIEVIGELLISYANK
jgi:hypothetical protein